jgi:hypothetical protein
MVKVDMARASNGRAITSPVEGYSEPVTLGTSPGQKASEGQVRGRMPTRDEVEIMMIDRHLIGDVGLAVLLAFPTLALARPQAPAASPTNTSSIVEKAAVAEQTPVQRRFNLPS